MVKKLLLSILLFPSITLAQLSPANVIIFNGAPTGTCPPILFAIDKTTGALYDCFLGTWNKVGPSAGGGSVTDVTGTPPIASSGGATPDISISQSGVASDGYLSSVDWGIFNAKQPAISSHVAVANNFLTGFTAPNTFTGAQPSCSNLSDAGTGCSGNAYPGLVAHDILSASHGDTTPAAVQRGDLITGQGVSPTWARLAKGGASECLQMDGGGTDIVWGSCAAGGFPRLDQVLDPNADKAFSMGSNKLSFIGGNQSLLHLGPVVADYTADVQAQFSGNLVEMGNIYGVPTGKTVLMATSQGMHVATASISSFISSPGEYGSAIYAFTDTFGSDNPPYANGIEIANGHFSTGTLAEGIGIRIFDMQNGGGGTITKNTGLQIEDQVVASTNYAIKTGLGQVDFGDTVKGASTINAVTGFQVNSAATLNNVLKGNGTNFVDAQLLLDQVGNPSASHTFNMANKSLAFSFTNPSGAPTYDGAFEIEATGAFTGDLLHVHQHTGNPGAGTDAVHIETSDADVLPLNIISGATYGLTSNKPLNVTVVTGTAPLTIASTTEVANLHSATATALAADPSDCGANTLANAIAASGNLTCRAVVEADISLSDNTTDDVSTTKHGFVPKGTNLGKFLRDDGTWQSVTVSLPSGLIVFIASGTCPAGFTEVAGLSGKFVLGTTAAGGDVGTTGGSSSYTPAGTNGSSAVSGIVVDAHASHTHTYTDVINHVHPELAPSSASGGALTLGIDTNASGSQSVGLNTGNPSGGVATGTTAGPSASLTHNVSNNGTAAAQTFTGTPATITPPYIKLIGCSSN